MIKSGISLSIILVLVLFSCTQSSNKQAEGRKPNILFIAVDDMKPDLSFYGNKVVKTPGMDRLAESSAIFMNNHCQQALCGPSRASLLTGKYPDDIRIWGFNSIRERNPDIVTLPQYFKNKGFTTANISKVFDKRTVDYYWDSLSWSETAFPLEEEDLDPWYSKETGPVTTYFYQSPVVKDKFSVYSKEAEEKGLNPIPYTQKFIKPATECLDVPDDAYKDGVFAEKAISDLERLVKMDNPFFLAVGFERPHLPWTAPKKYWDLYERDSLKLSDFMQLAQNDRDYFYTTSNELRTYSDEYGNFVYEGLKDRTLLSEAAQKKLIHGYYAAISYIDHQIEKILNKLDELGESDNTIIVIWGDHGWHLGDHGIWGKSTNFEQATRAPLIVHVPGEKFRQINQPTEFVDIFPTLCDLTGIEIPADLRGSSLRNLVEGNNKEQKSYAFSQFTRNEKMGYAIRSKRYRYVEWLAEGKHVNPQADYNKVADKQLFDYLNDPLETVNIAGEDSVRETENELAEELHRFYERLSD